MREMGIRGLREGVLVGAFAVFCIFGCSPREDEASVAYETPQPAHPALRSTRTVPATAAPFRRGHAGETPAPQEEAGLEQPPADSKDLPLPADGMNGEGVLKEDLERLADPEVRQDYERAFRLSFTEVRARRNHAEAIRLLDRIVEKVPGFAPAYRSMAYAYWSTGNPAKALELYRKAVEVDPDYGVGHHALSLFYQFPGFEDQEKAAFHLKRAADLGVKVDQAMGSSSHTEPE